MREGNRTDVDGDSEAMRALLAMRWGGTRRVKARETRHYCSEAAHLAAGGNAVEGRISSSYLQFWSIWRTLPLDRDTGAPLWGYLREDSGRKTRGSVRTDAVVGLDLE